jgi:hypothetical protein
VPQAHSWFDCIKNLKEQTMKTETMDSTTLTTAGFVKDLNAKAVAYMYQGSTEQAIQVLHQAARYLQKHTTKITNWTAAKDIQVIPTEERLLIPFGIGPVNTNPFGHVMYETAFLLACPVEDTTAEYQELATAVVLYNTALAYHLYGLKTGKRKILLDAATLYTLIVTKATTATTDVNYGISKDFKDKSDKSTIIASFQEFPALLLLGASNNLVHIHLALYAVSEMQAARTTLRGLLKHVISCPSMLFHLSPGDCQSHHVLSFFRMNLLCLEQQESRHAPVA